MVATDRGGKIFNRDVRLSQGARLVVDDIIIVNGDGQIVDPTISGTITADDINLASGAVVAGVGTGANGITLKNLKNAAASGLSGTQRDIQIDIGGTPYYFTVYPTKA